jgi:cobyrinic acid a,c-diamide synthase
MSRGLLIAAPASGSGKTVLTLGLLRAFRNGGRSVASVKCGPDYIDPAYHTAASGRPCVNLDTWAMSRDLLAELTRRTAEGADLVLGEGVMGQAGPWSWWSTPGDWGPPPPPWSTAT